MKFIEAINKALPYEKIRRKEWNPKDFIFVSDTGELQNSLSIKITTKIEDINATDWVIERANKYLSDIFSNPQVISCKRQNTNIIVGRTNQNNDGQLYFYNEPYRRFTVEDLTQKVWVVCEADGTRKC